MGERTEMSGSQPLTRIIGGLLPIPTCWAENWRFVRLVCLSLILECLAHGITLDDINEAYDHCLLPEALSEVLQVASELTESFYVAV